MPPIGLLLLSCAGLLAPVAGLAETLNLSCAGISTHTRAATTSGMAFGNDGAAITTSATSYYRAEAPDRVTVEIDGDAGRVRVPVTIIPALHSGGKDGWWTLDHVVVGDTAISASFSLNFMNKPRVRIDRRVGEITIIGLGKTGFRGTCEVFNPDPAARKF